MPHPDLPGTPESPEQGYVGRPVVHTNFETATADFTSEYGPKSRTRRHAGPFQWKRPAP